MRSEKLKSERKKEKSVLKKENSELKKEKSKMQKEMQKVISELQKENASLRQQARSSSMDAGDDNFLDFLPGRISAPSQCTNIAKLEPNLTITNFRSLRVFFEAFSVMVGLSDCLPENSDRGKYMMDSMGYILRPRDFQGSKGYHCDQGKFILKEIVYSSFMTMCLQTFVPKVLGKKIDWLHQYPDPSNGVMDVVAYLNEENGDMTFLPVASPLLLMEFSRNNTVGSKHSQLAAYAFNISCQMTSLHQVFLGVEVYVNDDDKIFICVRGFYFGKDKKKCNDCEIWSGEIDTNGMVMGRLITAIEIVAKHNLSARDPSLLHDWLPRGNAVIDKKNRKVLKVYNHKTSAHDRGSRGHELSYKYIEGAEIINGDDEVVLLQYPIIKGVCWPATVGHVITIAEKLCTMHKAGDIHGDVRAFNCVFGEDPKRSFLIDFDFSGSSEKVYPVGFNTNIDDGARHPKAREGQCLDATHDWFALAGMMELLTCKNQQNKWKKAIEHFKKGQFDDAIDILQRFNKSTLSLIKRSTFESLVQGTGSPPTATSNQRTKKTNTTITKKKREDVEEEKSRRKRLRRT